MKKNFKNYEGLIGLLCIILAARRSIISTTILTIGLAMLYGYFENRIQDVLYEIRRVESEIIIKNNEKRREEQTGEFD